MSDTFCHREFITMTMTGMKQIVASTFIIVLLLTGCVSTDLGAQDLTISEKWTEHSVIVGTSVIKFSVPGNQSRAGPVPTDPDLFFDLDDPRLSDPAHPFPLLYQGYWDYGGGRWKQPDGSLTLRVMIGRAPPNVSEDIRDRAILSHAIWQANVQYEIIVHNEEIESGVLQLPDETPYVPRNVNGREWLYFESPIGVKKVAYPIDPRNFLLVSTNLTLKKGDNNYDVAVEMQNSIISSLCIVNGKED